MGYRFSRIDPTNPFSGEMKYDGLREAVHQAGIRFGATRGCAEHHWTKPSSGEIEECIDLLTARIVEAERQRAAYLEDGDERGDGELLTVVAAFIDLLMDRDDEGLEPLQLKLRSGRAMREVDMLAALALRQCDRTAGAIERRNAREVSFLMWDIHELLTEILWAETRETENSAVVTNARRAAHARHAENRAMKAQVREHYAVNQDKYPSKDAAAEAMAGRKACAGHRRQIARSLG